MAYSDKDIIIIPNTGSSTNDPVIKFTHGTASTSGTISLAIEQISGVSALTVTGSQGKLFTVADSFTGTIFAITDSTGIPILASDNTGTVVIGQYKGTLDVRSTATIKYATITTATIVNLSSSTISSYNENVSSVSISTNTLTLDLSSAGIFEVTLNANITTLTLTNPGPSGKSKSFTLIINYTSTSYSISWPASFKWSGATAPTLTNVNGKKDIFTFFTTDGGTSYNAFISGLNF